MTGPSPAQLADQILAWFTAAQAASKDTRSAAHERRTALLSEAGVVWTPRDADGHALVPQHIMDAINHWHGEQLFIRYIGYVVWTDGIPTPTFRTIVGVLEKIRRARPRKSGTLNVYRVASKYREGLTEDAFAALAVSERDAIAAAVREEAVEAARLGEIYAAQVYRHEQAVKAMREQFAAEEAEKKRS